MTEKDFVVSADGHLLEPTDLFLTRLPKHLRDRAVWEEDFEIEPLVEGGARIFRRLHTPGFEGWTISRYRQTGGRMPEGDPELILEDMDLDGVDVQVMHPNLSLFGLYSDDHELSMAHARVYNDYVIERFTPYFSRLAPTAPVPLTDIDDAVAEIERVAAAGFRAILLPAIPPKPYYSRDFDPVWAAAQANGVHVFIHTQTGGVKVNDPGVHHAQGRDGDRRPQVNQPMTEKSASQADGHPVRLRPDRPAAGHLRADRRRRPRALPRPALRAHRVQRPLAGVAGRLAWTSAGSPGSARTPTGGSATGTTTRPADDQPQHGAAVPPEREVAVPADAERVRPPPVPRLVPGRPGGRRVPAHHRAVDHRVGQRLPARRGHVPRQPGADRQPVRRSSRRTSGPPMVGGTLGGLLGFEAPVAA